jgi:PAS domain S-box-containing protein
MERKKSYEELLSAYEAVRARLEEAEDTLTAIRNHEVDALVAEGPSGDQIFTLQGAEQPYRILVETMSESALTMTPAGVVLYCNSQLTELLKLPLHRIMGASFYDFLVSHDHRQSFKAMLEACGKRGCRGEFLLKGAHGQEVPTLLSGRSLMLNDVEALCIVATDLTEQKRAQEFLLESEARLRQSQKMEAMGALAGGIAHDFNNILAAIIGITEMVLDDVSDNPFVRQRLERVLQASFRGRDLIRQILAFSRKSAGERKQFGLTSLIQEMHGLLRSTLPTTIRMPLAIRTSDDYVLADPTQIEQVLVNLVTNAAYAMRDGGQLTIGVSSVTFPRGSLLPDPDLEPGSYVKLTVKDTGTGMTEEVRQRIFEPFFTTKEQGKGTGMGLAVVYGIVKSHGGAITVKSEVGQGSIFDVFLPQAQKPEVTKGEETTSTLPTGTERILFVDDEELLLETMRCVLASLGYHVTVAQHGTEAWSLFLEDPSRFDLVITDQIMPDTTGLALAQKMLRVRKEMPIILCTGYSEMVSVSKAKEVGICEFFMKPVTKKELAETIRKALDGRKE